MMLKTSSDLPSELQRLYPDGPPCREEHVLGQKVEFNPEVWKTYLNKVNSYDFWPFGDAQFSVTRTEVFELGRTLAPIETSQEPVYDDAIRFYIKVTAWGAGKSERPWKKPLVLRDPAAGEKLLGAIGLLRNEKEGVLAAYRSMDHGGKYKLRDLGPSYYTKLLYFAGYDYPLDPRPLIYDQRVATALRQLTREPFRYGSFNSYRRYLDQAASWAKDWDTEPDVVERVLFAYPQVVEAT
ncbi:MAG: hypothetical protein FWG16_03490 [Micrococcales bacterium]|nr:hypothetical protein [Micrococcales bacterium]